MKVEKDSDWIWSLILGNQKQISCCFYDPAKEKKETPRFKTSNLSQKTFKYPVITVLLHLNSDVA